MLLIKGFTSSESDKYGRMFRMMRDGHITIDPSTQTQDPEAKRQSYELLVWQFDMLKASEEKGGNGSVGN